MEATIPDNTEYIDTLQTDYEDRSVNDAAMDNEVDSVTDGMETSVGDNDESTEGEYVSVTYEQMLQIRDDLISQYDKIQQEKGENESLLEQIRTEREEQKKVYDKFISEKTAFNEDMKTLNAKMLQERKRLKEETTFFDKKMQILQNGFMQLDLDRKQFEREKAEFETVRAAKSVRQDKAGMRVGGVFNASQFFIGVNSSLACRKRYKDLLKIFHPDNLCGDETLVKAINEEYERLRIEFNG